MTTARFLSICILTAIAPAASADSTEESVGVRFNEHIRPLLSEYCFACHGPDAASRKADLRLDTRAAALSSGFIVPGNSDDSELIARITSTDPEVMMPPPESGKKLNQEHRQLLSRWIDAGASWEEHWSFVKPHKSKLPRPDGVQQWAGNPIDHFILEQLRESGLSPNEEADRHTLARRAALDITGLPPGPDLLETFLSDTDEHAYVRYVETLLSSKRAGEHRGRYWLDAARYGDTHGMHVDNYREIWPYRDWVIRAFNANMPFDRFVIEQIAGDLLPNATLDQRIATGFNRCNITTSEGGAIPEEVNVRYMIDRVETTATVFLGLTAGCAVCHDHKFDPITQREFYQLGAFFNNTTQPAMDGNQKDTPPVVTLPDAKFQDEWNRLQTRRNELRIELGQWSLQADKWWPSHSTDVEHPVATDGLVLYLPFSEGENAKIANAKPAPAAPEFSLAPLPIDLPAGADWAADHPAGRRGVRFGERAELSVNLEKFRSDEPLSVSFWFRTPDRLIATTLFQQTIKTEDDKTVGWKITSSTQGGLSFQLSDSGGRKISGNLPDNEALRPHTWQHVCVRYSGGQSNSSVSILVNGRAGSLRNSSELHVEATELADTPLKIASNLPTAGLSDVRIFRRWVSDEETLLLAEDSLIRKLCQSDTAWNELAQPDRTRLARFYRQALTKEYRTRSRELSATEKRRDYIYARSTTTLVMQEQSSQPRAWVLARGEYDQRRDEVSPGVPAVLPSLPEDGPRNRLALAQWLVHPNHPLTARVMINRLWQSVFGLGLVKTSEDFGVMGAQPTHPELLDWLAVEFIESGWNVNHILKLILTSAAYRQSSVISSEKLRLDLDNRLLSRGPRLRLDAEVLRDQALAVSRLLRRDLGGPSVRPYQPAGLWRVVAITGSNTNEFRRDSGDALYRRSVYTFWKRTSPPPAMAAFNAPTREQCTVRRERTNTPLQALVLMNDPQFVETARHLAENTMKQHDNDRARASWMLTTVLSRPASEIDVTEMATSAEEFRAIFLQQPTAAKKLIDTGESTPDSTLDPIEVAAWTMVANTVMNRDDFINK